MGNKIGSDWTVESVSPEGAIEVMAQAANISVARAAFDEALRHRPGRVVRLLHGPRILESRIGAKVEQPRGGSEQA